MTTATYTVAEYAEERGVSPATARRRLNQLVEQGRATVMTGVIIGTTTRKRGGRSKPAHLRGNQYTIKQGATR